MRGKGKESKLSLGRMKSALRRQREPPTVTLVVEDILPYDEEGFVVLVFPDGTGFITARQYILNTTGKEIPK